MDVFKTIKLKMTEVEKGAAKIVHGMLYDLEWEDERAIADELDLCNLDEIRTNLAKMYELGGGDMEDLK